MAGPELFVNNGVTTAGSALPATALTPPPVTSMTTPLAASTVPAGTYKAVVVGRTLAGGTTPAGAEGTSPAILTANNNTVVINWTVNAAFDGGYDVYLTAPNGAAGSERYVATVAAGVSSYTWTGAPALTAQVPPSGDSTTTQLRLTSKVVPDLAAGAGQYRVILGASAPYEYAVATAVSGLNVTLTRGQEGSTAAALASGGQVTFGITVAGLGAAFAPPLADRGAYAAGTAYALGDRVTQGGQLFTNVLASTGVAPTASTTTANWRFDGLVTASGTLSLVDAGAWSPTAASGTYTSGTSRVTYLLPSFNSLPHYWLRNAPHTAAETTFDVTKWLDLGPVEVRTESAARVLEVLQEATYRPVRILTTGTSISSFGNSANQVMVEYFKTLFGDSRGYLNSAGGFGGSFTSAVNGWKHQPYGGPSYYRAVGDTTATGPLLFGSGAGDTVVVETSLESGGGTTTVLIDGTAVGTVSSVMQRTVADGATTSGSATVTSPTAGAFSSTIGQPVTGSGIPAGTTILSTNNTGTSAVLSNTATATAATVSLTVGANVQQYGQRQVFTVAAGAHSVSLAVPTTGTVYWERVEVVSSTRVGVEHLDGSLGGSGLNNTQFPPIVTPGAGLLAAGTVGTYVGLDAIFGRTDYDLVIYSGPVNDSGYGGTSTAQFSTQLDRAIADTKANNVPLILQIEPAGHNSHPNDGGSISNYQRFNEARAVMLAAGRNNSHVVVIDWHGAMILTDLAKYASDYYNVTGFNPATGTYTNGADYIHPKPKGQQVGTAAWVKALALPMPTFVNTGTPRDARLVSTFNPVRDNGATATSALTGESHSYSAPAGMAVKYAGVNIPQPYYRDDTILDESAASLNIQIAASGTSDAYGKYKTVTNFNISPGNANYVAGERVFVTVLGRNPQILTSTPLRMFDQGNLLATAGSQPNNTIATGVSSAAGGAPTAVVAEVGTTGGAAATGGAIAVSGDIYAVTLSRTNVPILSRKNSQGLHSVGPEQYLVGDPIYDPSLLGQRFFEDLGAGVLVSKELVSYCFKYDPVAATFSRRGVYRATDRTAAGYVLCRANSPSSAPTGILGGGGESSPYGNQTSGATRLTLAAPLLRTILFKATGPSLSIQLFNGGNYSYLNNDGTWQTAGPDTPVQLYTAFPYGNGENVAVTFTLPTAAAQPALGTPQLNIYTGSGNGNPLSSVTHVYGSSACF